ncbi:MAG: hypothetical protein WB697_22300 [Stellaceae bacterium]
MENREQRPASNADHGSMGEDKDEHTKPGEGSGQERDPAKGQGVTEKERDPSEHGAGRENDKGDDRGSHRAQAARDEERRFMGRSC